MSALRIGFASVYAWRPHVEHMMFLARLVEEAGHTPVFLTCDADLPACYTRELRDVRPDWMECLLCRAGGVRSYTARRVTSMGSLVPAGVTVTEAARAWAASSASTLGRFESAADYATPEFRALRDRLAPSVALAFDATRAWIARERLDAVCVFNGRIDATRGIFEAARAAGVRVITLERSWSGNGLQLLVDEICIGLRSVHEMVGHWNNRPLTGAQARLAASRIAARLTGTNLTEWRAYNTQARPDAWPAHGQRRLLLLPGSLNETWGIPDWESHWPEPVAAYDAIITRLGLSAEDLVLRCHPNWGEFIGKRDGRLPEAYYSGWARSRGIHVIGSSERTSTMSLIAQCDAVVLANGSAALEAAAMGKQVISTAPSTYHHAGFRTDATRPELIDRLELDVSLAPAARTSAEEHLRRGTLRYAYTTTHRLPQYVKYVRALSSSAYRYLPGADPGRFVDLVKTGVLQPDDPTAARDSSDEDVVLAQMRDGRWSELDQPARDTTAATGRIRRRWFLRPIDFVREKLPVGDR